jgi:large subunit ribosomal protein L13
MKTYSPKAGEVNEKWWVVDAEGQVLGRLASRVAAVLRGKHRPEFTPHMDLGDHVVVINAAKVVLSGNKSTLKTYERYSGYPGGRRVIPLKRVLNRHPERIVERAIKGMLPHNRLGRNLYRKLRVYAGPEHPHVAQKPEPLSLEPTEASE